MKRLFLGIFFLFSNSLLFTAMACGEACIRAKLDEAAALKAAYKEKQALQLYEEVLRYEPLNTEALWNASFLHTRLGWLVEEDAGYDAVERRKFHFTRAYEYAKKLYAIDSTSFEANLVMGASEAKLAKYLSTREKIQIAWNLKRYADEVFKHRDDLPDMWYIYGWWHFSIARASSFERFMAKLVYDGLPEGASIDSAIACLERAISLRPDYTVYYHDLARFYLYLGDSDKAIALLEKGLTCPVNTPEDSIYQNYCRKEITALRSP